MKAKILLPMVLVALLLLLERCNNGTKKTESLGATAITVNFSPTPPSDLPEGADSLQLSEFAWEEFLSLNWKSSYYSNGLRDSPDTAWSYQDSSKAYPDLDVWETFAHRTELRPFSDTMLPFKNPPHYSFGITPVPDSPSSSFKLFNNLDENNEIGSCDMYAHTDTAQGKYQVLYEAKVNRAEYNYILANYNTRASLLKATSNTMENIAKDSAYYPGATTTCSGPNNVICLPCGHGDSTGTMEIKAAWRQLTPQEVKTVANRYFTRKVITYSIGPRGTVVYHNTVYALIALHIIHKTQNYPAFVFATFQQVDVQNVPKEHMAYVLLNSFEQQTGKPKRPVQDSIRAVTEATSAYVHSKLPRNSVWQYYHLVGVQAKPVNYADSASQNINFFLANYVVESDSTLGRFNGSGIGTPHNHLPNLLYKGKFFSMGGCQGCHGVAQVKNGTDFSFLLDTVGKPVIAPDIANVNSLPKLQRYIRASNAADAKIAQIKTAAKSKLK